MFIAICSNLDISLSYSSSFHYSSNAAEQAVRIVKNILKKCLDDNLGNSTQKIGLFEYLCTLISDSIPSPAELLNNMDYKGFKPFLKPLSSSFRVTKDTVPGNLISLKEREKMNHDEEVTDLPKINEGSDVWYQDHNKDVWEKGTAVKGDLVNDDGKIERHNCVDYKKCFNKVEHKDHGNIPKPPTKSVKSQSSVTCKSHKNSTKHGVAVTWYGRVVNPHKEWICK